MKIVRDAVKVGQKIVVGMILVEFLSFGIGPLVGNDANAAFAVAVTVVGGSYWIYRKRHPRKANGKFGEGLRGSEVEDHSNES